MDNYYNPDIFLTNPSAWYMDSVLSGASEKEVKLAKEKVKTMKLNGTLNKFLEDNDELPKYGCGRIVVAIKK